MIRYKLVNAKYLTNPHTVTIRIYSCYFYNSHVSSNIYATTGVYSEPANLKIQLINGLSMALDLVTLVVQHLAEATTMISTSMMSRGTKRNVVKQIQLK